MIQRCGWIIYFETSSYDGKNFKKKIEENHYAIFLKLQAYDAKEFVSCINNYIDFVQSECQLLVLINDVEYVEVYVKHEGHAEEIYRNAVEAGYKDIRYITSQNDTRIEMNLL